MVFGRPRPDTDWNVPIPSTVDDLEAAFVAQGYVPERSLSIAIHLAVQMGKPLFVEGEPGVGKTEIAKVLASISGGELIRLQCYEWARPLGVSVVSRTQDHGSEVHEDD